MHCHCGTNNRAPRWTFTDPCKPEVRPGAREESASPAWLAAPAMNARDKTKVYIWKLDIDGPKLNETKDPKFNCIEGPHVKLSSNDHITWNTIVKVEHLHKLCLSNNKKNCGV